jgi:hypothetical protein
MVAVFYILSLFCHKNNRYAPVLPFAAKEKNRPKERFFL